jgi:membrane protease YdiL (CAAX protease family)
VIAAVIVLGVVAQVVAWWAIASRGSSIWSTLAPVLAVAGALAVVVGKPALAGRERVWLVLVVGFAVGTVLFVATRVFIAIVAPRWERFDRHSRAIYAAGGRDTPAHAVLAAGAVAIGEELFWRGLTQEELAARIGTAAAAAVVAWLGYVVVNLPSRNLAIIAGAVVGGAAWGALAWWSAGVLASVACHATWTALMLARPPIASATR